MSRRPEPDATWSGCHGVQLVGAPFDLGAVSGEPLTTATVKVGGVGQPDGEHLWTQHGEVFVGSGMVDIDRSLYRQRDGHFVLASSRGPALEVDAAARVITIAEGDESVQRQLLASFGVPLLLREEPVLIVHGAACGRGGEAVVVCAKSGSGKSSLFVHLVDSGWCAISEDMCVIDLRGDRPRIWPGPPWVRILRGEPGPRGARLGFESGDKTGWDTSDAHATTATDLARIVVLDAPGGDAVVTETLRAPDALRALARHAVWLDDPDEKGRRLFGPAAAVVARVPATRVRFPRRDAWRETIPDLLAVS